MEKWRPSLGKHSLINASGVIRTALPLRHSTRSLMTSPMFHVASAPIRRATPTITQPWPHRRHPTRHVHLQRPGLPRPTGMNTTTDHIQVVGAGPFGQITGPLLADLLRCTTQTIARRRYSLRDCDARNRFGQQTIRVGDRCDDRQGLERAPSPFDHRIPAPGRRGRPRNPPAMRLKRIRHRQAGCGGTAITEAPAPAADFRGREPDYGASR
jgi:hypothetical protein